MIIQGDALTTLKTLPDASVHMVITSPPYWRLRDYGIAGQLGLEDSGEHYLTKLCQVFDEIKRVLRADGTCWVNIADSYSGSSRGFSGRQHGILGKKAQKFLPKAPLPRSTDAIPPKSLCLIPFRFATAMVNRGWILRNTIIWQKPNAIPESVTDRFTVDFEYLFFFVKSRHYWFNQQWEKAKEQDRCRHTRCVWSIPTVGFPGNHYAVYPERLLETPIKAGCPEGGVILDPFLGSGTTALVAQKLGRRWIGIELNPEYVVLARQRIQKHALGYNAA
jgi:site-specific DNA-methyltransferase (cytosine-N4-specific)